MADRRNHTPQATNCKCNKCGAEANAPPGKKHRKCPLAKGQEKPGQYRGVWEKR